MTCSFSQHGTIQLIKVDNLNIPQYNRNIIKKVENLIDDGFKEFVVDLSQTTFINSTGLSFLVAVLTKTRNAGGETSLVYVSHQVSKLLIITKLQSFFNIHKDLEAALKSQGAALQS